MKRSLSGIKPSGEPTLGNYLGAMKRWAREQDKTENFYFVPNLHALTTRPDPKELRKSTLSAVAWLLAVGVDPKKAVIFIQSHIPAHSEMAWILNNYVTMGELSRMTQFKDKSQKASPEGQLVGLFDYPVLMAADILLYDADQVPVGEDQVQHVELTRDIANRFNKLYGPVFKVPKATVAKSSARVMNLQNPSVKMSTSDSDKSGVIYLSDSPDVIQDKIKRAVTDSGSDIKAAADKPAVTNLLQIYSSASGKTIAALEKQYAGKGYAKLKTDLADLVVAEVGLLQEKYRNIMTDPTALAIVLEDGRQKAVEIAGPKLEEAKQAAGIL